MNAYEWIGKILKWLILGSLLLMVTAVGLFFLRVPRQNWLVCAFDDGDRMVIREKYWWYPAYAFTRVGGRGATTSVDAYYKPRYWVEGWKDIGGFGSIGRFTDEPNDRKGYCSIFRKIGGVITTENYYKLPGSRVWQEFPYYAINSVGMHEETGKRLKEKKLALTSGSSMVSIGSSAWLREKPLIPTKIECAAYQRFEGRPPCNVDNIEGVLQSFTYDNGQTWSSQLVVTRESKLYELGKPLYEQKGVAQAVDWSGKPWWFVFGKKRLRPVTCYRAPTEGRATQMAGAGSGCATGAAK